MNTGHENCASQQLIECFPWFVFMDLLNGQRKLSVTTEGETDEYLHTTEQNDHYQRHQ